MDAAVEMLQKVQTDVICSICRSYFSEPVTLHCGHSFCRECLSSCWRAATQLFSCPECRQVPQSRALPPVNERLTQLTDLVKRFSSHVLQSTKGQSQCALHGKVFKLFCKQDQTLLCVRCESPEHEAHGISPVGEAAHECRKQLQNMQNHLGKHFEEAESLLAQQSPVDWRRMIIEEYRKLHCLVMTQEFSCIERISQEQRARQDRLTQHKQTLQKLKLEVQEADNQPDLDLLQDAKHLLERGESELSQRTKTVIPELKEYPIPGLIEMLNRFRVDIRLISTSAISYVSISEDLRSVKATEDWEALQHLQDSECYAALAKESFSSGRHYWEVDVSQVPQWVLGIYTTYLGRKTDRDVESFDYAFLLQCVKNEDGYYIRTYSGSLNHRLKGPIPRVGIYLEYSPGSLAFYNVLQRSLIYKFDPISFTAPPSSERRRTAYLFSHQEEICPAPSSGTISSTCLVMESPCSSIEDLPSTQQTEANRSQMSVLSDLQCILSAYESSRFRFNS
ncbi:tripartite motif-containing protein 64-like [Sarcophilus harrisii]|uniref:tripartite motif-containing protein 64-like n=1 Tax=Sarcophilus harrisii TaxID=9305 RepID=UPI001301C4DF|nr:tripartite motif-containing protein 64-like [Sarcophilus harrisii]